MVRRGAAWCSATQHGVAGLCNTLCRACAGALIDEVFTKGGVIEDEMDFPVYLVQERFLPHLQRDTCHTCTMHARRQEDNVILRTRHGACSIMALGENGMKWGLERASRGAHGNGPSMGN